MNKPTNYYVGSTVTVTLSKVILYSILSAKENITRCRRVVILVSNKQTNRQTANKEFVTMVTTS